MKKELRFGFALMAVILVTVAVLMPWGSLTNGHLGLLMLALIVVAIMLGFPTAFTLMGMGVFFSWLFYRSVNPDIAVQQTLDLMVQRAYSVMTNEVLLAIPLFIFMGYLVERANLIEKLFHSIHLAMARVPGSLAVATLITCTIFATATGIIGAVVTLMGLLALPAMLRAGYDVRVSAGCVTAGGCLGILIPPSVLLIVYGATAGVSVVDLYAGAFFPGVMLATLYMLYIVLLAKWKPALMPPLSMEQRVIPLPPALQSLAASFGQKVLPALWRALKGPRNAALPMPVLARQAIIALLPALVWSAIMVLLYRAVTAAPEAVDLSAFGVTSSDAKEAAPTGVFWIVFGVGSALLVLFYAVFTVARLELFKMLLGSFFPLATLILAVLGSIVFGLATPTEASAVGALGGLVLAAAYRQLNYGVVRESAYLTAKTSAMVCWLFVGSAIFSAAFALLGGQELIERWVLSMNLSPIEFLLLSQFIIFILGWPLEWTEIIVIFMPIFIPLLKHFSIDPLFFGLLVALNLQTAFLSPPVAMAAFYLKGVAPKHVTLNQIFAGMMPFMAIQVLAMVILYLFPQIGLWLPGVIYK
jgi:TRAP-type mannitol/chloroaromatic compound transport system permease large subunit